MTPSEKLPISAQIDYKSLADRLERRARFNSDRAPKIAVVGDYCLDKYLYLYPALDEKSVETGKIAYQARAKRLFAGVGGTIANNLRALGAETYCFGVVGEDGEGFDLLRALKRVGANVDGIVVSDEILTGAYVGDLFDAALKQMACKAAIKAGDYLRTDAVVELIVEAEREVNSHHCPHGRPSTLLFSCEELDKLFKRL